MPARHGRNRPFRRPTRQSRPDDTVRVQFVRRTMAKPPAPVSLVSVSSGSEPAWELVCRDGWEWRSAGPGLVAVRVARLTDEQAHVVEGWLQRIREPATWWGVSRELQQPDSVPEVAAALRQDPWLANVLPVVLEASTEGAPPPPPTSAATENAR